jgi:uncharacterized membrane protein
VSKERWIASAAVNFLAGLLGGLGCLLFGTAVGIFLGLRVGILSVFFAAWVCAVTVIARRNKARGIPLTPKWWIQSLCLLLVLLVWEGIIFFLLWPGE